MVKINEGQTLGRWAWIMAEFVGKCRKFSRYNKKSQTHKGCRKGLKGHTFVC